MFWMFATPPLPRFKYVILFAYPLYISWRGYSKYMTVTKQKKASPTAQSINIIILCLYEHVDLREFKSCGNKIRPQCVSLKHAAKAKF